MGSTREPSPGGARVRDFPYGLARPPETFRRSRAHRDMQRRRSQWEVRVKQHRGVPPPPWVDDGSF